MKAAVRTLFLNHCRMRLALEDLLAYMEQSLERGRPAPEILVNVSHDLPAILEEDGRRPRSSGFANQARREAA